MASRHIESNRTQCLAVGEPSQHETCSLPKILTSSTSQLGLYCQPGITSFGTWGDATDAEFTVNVML
jgi:hypothetical protein